jgi:hypothetical protein
MTNKAPLTRVCHICGRQYSLGSFLIHLKQCEDLWIAREQLKSSKERRPIPINPNEKFAIEISEHQSIEKLNKQAIDSFNTESLKLCEYCGRTFLEDKLIIHHKSCTFDNPARKVRETVNRRELSRPQTANDVDNVRKNPRKINSSITLPKILSVSNNTINDNTDSENCNSNDTAYTSTSQLLNVSNFKGLCATLTNLESKVDCCKEMLETLTNEAYHLRTIINSFQAKDSASTR